MWDEASFFRTFELVVTQWLKALSLESRGSGVREFFLGSFRDPDVISCILRHFKR